MNRLLLPTILGGFLISCSPRLNQSIEISYKISDSCVSGIISFDSARLDTIIVKSNSVTRLSVPDGSRELGITVVCNRKKGQGSFSIGQTIDINKQKSVDIRIDAENMLIL